MIRSVIPSSTLKIENVQIMSVEEGITDLIITPETGADIREALFRAFAANDLPLLELHRERASLEDVFLELTQGAPEEDLFGISEEPETDGEEVEAE